jgi:multiple antibiotic resistance protein
VDTVGATHSSETMVPEELRQLVGAFLLVVGGLLPIVNPVGSAPMFLAMTQGSDEATREALAARIAVNTFMLLLGSMIFGTLVLRMFGLSVPVVQVAGGAVLCALGWKMLTQDAATHPDALPVNGQGAIARAFYPLTLPLTVDPGAISVAIAIGANHAHGIERVIIGIIASVSGIALIAGAVWLAYHYAERISRWLGHNRMMVVLRLSAFVVLCIGVQIGWNGIRTLALDLSFAPPTAVPAPSPTVPAPVR